MAIGLTVKGVLLATLLLGGQSAWSQEVRGVDVGTHGQLEFEWDTPTDYRLQRNDNRIIVVFDQQIGDGAAQAFRRVGGYLEEGRIIGDGSTILLVLQPDMSLVERQDGGTVFFELRPPGRTVETGPRSAPQPVPVPAQPDPVVPPTPAVAPQPPSPAEPADRPVIRVRGGEHSDYSRVVFDWTASVGYQVEQSGDQIRIIFEAPANADFSRAAPAGLSRVNALRQLGDSGGLVVGVTVPADSRLSHFRLGTKIVLDIRDGDGGRIEQAEAPAPALTPAPTPAPNAAPNAAPGANEDQPERSGPSTVTGREPSARVPQASASEPLSLLPKRAPERLPVETLPLPPGLADAADLTARFDPGVPSALAVFERGRSLWVVFASQSRLDANILASQGTPALGTVDVVRSEGGVALRFQPDRQGDVVVSRSGNQWIVSVEPAAIRPSRTLDLAPQPDYPLGPRLLIEGGTGPGLVRFADPLVGDVLIVAPIEEPAIGLMEEARLAQIRLLASVQGLVAKPMSETLAMRIASDGIEITDADGFLLSPSEDTAREIVVIAPPLDMEGRLLEVDTWQGPPGRGFIEQRQAIQRTLATVDKADIDRARLDLARFNFAHGLAAETLGLLNLVEESQPSIAGRENFIILRGAARVLSDELEDGMADLTHSGLADSRDAALWRGVAAAKSEDWTKAAREFEKAGRLIETYPRPFAELLVRLSAQTAIEMGDSEAAESQLARLSALTGGESQNWASTRYLRGFMAEKAGDVAAAFAGYDAAAGSQDRYYRTLSELALVELSLAEGDIDWEEAVASLESLRFAWRGDRIELGLIDRIEGLYWRNGRYRRALETLGQASRSFPGQLAEGVYETQLQARFVELFGSDRIKAMSPLEAISLYHDYAALMPKDDDGNRVLRGLAERLVDIDLLDQAGDILAELVDSRLNGMDKVRTGTRLAGIRLLSGQPESAIQALDDSDAVADLLPGLAGERRLLRAHALSELGESAAALDLLAADRTPIASAARADIAWRSQNWAIAAEAMGDLVKPPPPAGTPIPEPEAELLLNLGIALALANDVAGLDRLAERYGAAMARTSSANTFAILTRSPGGTPQIADLAAIRQQVSEVDLFQQFLRGYRTAGGPQG